MREVREVLPVRSAPQILNARDALAGCHRATFNGGCPGTSKYIGMTEELRRQQRPALKWMAWFALTIFLGERGGSRFCK